MPHQCVHCGKTYPVGSKELLEGCSECKSHFFFYIREDQLNKAKENPINLEPAEKKQIEKDVREMAGITDVNAPIVLDLEAIRVTGPGKFEIDVVNLFNQKRPLIYKLEEGKYIIDLSSGLNIEKDSNLK
jgi:predicted  nucleic acid-binding Zn-ribbon protein